MKTKPTTAAIEQFVEDVGIAMEQSGFPRMAGKVLGHLLVAPESEVSADDLATQLRASRGSISTMTRLLIQTGLIDRVGRRGERRDYFRIKGDTWSGILRARMAQIVDLHHAIERGIELIGPKHSAPHTRLCDMHEFYEFFEKEFQAILDRWEKRKKQIAKDTSP